MQRRGQNIVLDMDETLIHTFFELSKDEEDRLSRLLHLRMRVYEVLVRDCNETLGSGIVDPMKAIERPFLVDFLRFCSKRFDKVYIWSAGKRDYVHKHMRRLSRSSNISNVFTFDNCAVENDNDGGLIHKPLERVGLDPVNTFIVDDRATACIRNPENLVNLPAFMPTVEDLEKEATGEILKHDMALVRLMMYFAQTEVTNAPDVRLLPKDIFTEHVTEPTLLHETGTILEAPGNGNCLFSSIMSGVQESKHIAHAAKLTLINQRRVNTKYNIILNRFPDTVLPSASALRFIVAATYMNNIDRSRNYLDHCAEMRRAKESVDQIAWMETFWDGTSYNLTTFLHVLLDPKLYWGDWAAIDILADVLGLRIYVWKSISRELSYKTKPDTFILGSINLLFDGSHYDFMTDSHSWDDLLQQARPASSNPLCKRKRVQ